MRAASSRARRWQRRPPRACPEPQSRVLPVEDGALSIRERIDVLLRDDAKFAAAEVIPPKPAGSVGRSRIYPEFVWTLMPELWAIFPSLTMAVRELRKGGWWRYIRREMKRLHPELPELPRKPPTRQAHAYMRDRYLATDAAIERSLEIHTEFAVRQARTAGLLDPEGGGSPTHPEITRSIFGDGKKIEALYGAKPGTKRVDPETGEVREVRFDPDAAWHVEGGGDRVWGLNFATASVRCDEGRFMLGAEHVENDEAAMALVLLARIRRYAPGAQSVVWDMALRGEHLQEILTVLGLVPVVQVHAKANPKRGKGRKKGEYVPKTADIDDITVVMPDGSKEIVHIAAKDGWACVKTLTDTGDPHYEPLTCTRIQPHKTKKRHRWYGFYRLPEEYGGIEICLRLDTTREDGRRGLNRTENLRAIPEGSKDFERLWALRPDSESINNSIEEALWKKKASAKGWRRQMVDLLGYERVVNAITLARVRARQQLDLAA